MKAIQGTYGIGYSCDNAFVSLAEAVLAGFDWICVLVSVEHFINFFSNTMAVFEAILSSPAGHGLWWCLMAICCEPALPAQPWAAQGERSWSQGEILLCSTQPYPGLV